jgi:hypothetical protein
METPLSADILLRYILVVGHHISDSTISELLSRPPFLQLTNDLSDLLALIFATQDQGYLVIFPSFDPDHDFNIGVGADSWCQSNARLDG